MRVCGLPPPPQLSRLRVAQSNLRLALPKDVSTPPLRRLSSTSSRGSPVASQDRVQHLRATDPVTAVLTQETDHEQAVVTENKLTHNCGTLQIGSESAASPGRGSGGIGAGSATLAASTSPLEVHVASGGSACGPAAPGMPVPVPSSSISPMDHSAGHLAGSRSPAYTAALYSHGMLSPPKMMSPGLPTFDVPGPASTSSLGSVTDVQPSPAAAGSAAIRSGLQQSFRSRKPAPSSTGYSRRPGSLDRRPQSPLWRVSAGHLSDSGSSPERRDVHSPPEKSRKKRAGPYERPRVGSGRQQRMLGSRSSSRSDSHLQMSSLKMPSPEPRDETKMLPYTGHVTSRRAGGSPSQDPCGSFAAAAGARQARAHSAGLEREMYRNSPLPSPSSNLQLQGRSAQLPAGSASASPASPL